MAFSNIIQLRQLLRDKFPGLRTRADELPARTRSSWATGLADLDERLGGGFAKGALTEIIVSRRTCGGASLLTFVVQQAAAASQFVALIDGQDSFDPVSLDASSLNRLLWTRCHNAEEALKAADLVLRDGNLPLVIIDLALSPEAQLRKIPAPTWYRFQRIVEERGVTSLIFTPRAMISPAQVRITLESHFDLAVLECDAMEIVRDLEFKVSENRRGTGEEPLRRTA